MKGSGMVTKIGIDLGYANITISDASSGVFREPSVALIDKDTRRIISVGSSALEKENTVGSGVLVRPFKNGLLFDQQITQSIIKNAVSAVLPNDRVRCVIGTPSDFLPKQERELFGMFNDAGIAECLSVNRALAALVGAGFAPDTSAVSVNVGASSTEICIIIGGEILFTSRCAIGGEDFDKAVKQYIYEQGDVNVSLSVARAIKERLGAVWSGKPNESIEIEGTLVLTGNKVRMSITTEDIVGVFEPPLRKLFMEVITAIKKIPLDYVEKVFENGIVLTGGGSLIYGLDKMMSKVLGITVNQPTDPIDSVAKGLSRINSLIPVKGRALNKNITSLVHKYYADKKKAES